MAKTFCWDSGKNGKKILVKTGKNSGVRISFYE